MSTQRQVIGPKKFGNLPIEVVGTDSQGDTLTAETLRRFADQICLGHCLLTIDHSRIEPPIGRFVDARVVGGKGDAVLLADGVLYGTSNYCSLGQVLDSSPLNSGPVAPSSPSFGEDASPVVVWVISTKHPIAVAAADALRAEGVSVEVGRALKKGLFDVDTLTIIIGAGVLVRKSVIEHTRG